MFSDLAQYESRTFSQNGEDGVLARIFELIGTTSRFFVEIGTGPLGTERNTRLLEQRGWQGVLIDHDASGRAPAVRRAHVTAENINQLLFRFGAPREFDLLSIDVDGNDYWLWLALDGRYRPRVVVIEYNASASPHESRAIRYDPDFRWTITDYYGASLLALARLGRRKGYSLVYCESSGINAFFVRADLVHEPLPAAAELFRPMGPQHYYGQNYPRDARQLIDVESSPITGVVLAHNEAHQIVECLESLAPHVGEILLLNMNSSDATAELALPYVSRVLWHPHVTPFDAARNEAVAAAAYDWLWFVDADERIPPRTGELVNELIRTRGDEFEALTIPFKTWFCGKWIEHCGWWPGYTMPRVLKRGRFRFNPELHSGVHVDGRCLQLPPDPGAAVEHFSFRSIEHYLEKLNAYTSTEAQHSADQGGRWDWREAMRRMVRELWHYYEDQRGNLDGAHGWVLSWLSAQYRWLTHAKLIDLVDGQPLQPAASAPASLDEWFDFVGEELAAVRARQPQLPLGITLRSPIWDASGYADEGRQFAKALARGPRAVRLQDIPWSEGRCALDAAEQSLLRSLLNARRAGSWLSITNCIPTLAQVDPAASVNVLRTTFETDRIPASWHARLNSFDEIWVISRHNERAFRRSGVPPEKLRVVPSLIDTDLYRPDGQRLQLPEALRDRFVFLSVFDWQLRKGWDLLLAAYCQEFGAADGTGLLLKITRAHGHTQEQVADQAEAVLAQFGHALAKRPDIVIWDASLEQEQMAALYRSADAFVLASRGEGWGRPYMEAMASGLPTIGTAVSGNVDFMTEENSFLVPAVPTGVPPDAAAEISVYAGHNWFEPNVDALRRQLKTVRGDPVRRKLVANRAVADIRRQYDLQAGLAALEQAISACEARFRPVALPEPAADAVRVDWEGEFFASHSFSIINEQLVGQLASDPELALAVRRVWQQPTLDGLGPAARRIEAILQRRIEGAADVTIRHAFPPNWQSPPSGRWVHIQPWEFGRLPTDWIAPLRDVVDEIWAPSQYVRQVYIDSGIPPEKIHVIPWGIDPDVFHPDVPAILLPTPKSFRFLFVGGTIPRKGIDYLLEAYLAEFRAADDVCLVIKDMGTSTFYRDVNERERIRQLAADASNPQILYYDDHFTAGQLASLYTACHCLVAPYRGEGFGLPILEGLACGLPPIVPRGGPTDDFVSAESAFILPAEVVECQHAWPLCGPPTELRLQVADVRAAMRESFENRSALAAKGQVGSRYVREQYTWARTAQQMSARILALARGCTACERARPPHAPALIPRAPGQPLKQPTVGAIVRCRGRSNLLPDCLAYLRPFVDEMLVWLDEGDHQTAQIGREYGARVWPDPDLPAAQSAASIDMPNVSGEWVLVLDAEERMDEEQAMRLKAVLAAVADGVSSLAVRLLPNDGSSGEQSELRIFRNRPDLAATLRLGGLAALVTSTDRRVAIQSDLSIKVSQQFVASDTPPPPQTPPYEPWLQPWVPWQGRVCIDVGANVGVWTRWLARGYERVHAIEPNPDALGPLKADLPPNVTVHAVAAWNRATTVTFSQFAQSVHLSAHFKDEGIHTGPRRGQVRLPGRRIDSLGIEGPVDFLKCDTEGAEIECLQGAKQLMRRDRPWLLIEVHSSENFAKLARLLLEWGYEFTIIRDPNYPHFSRLWYEHFWLSCQHRSALGPS